MHKVNSFGATAQGEFTDGDPQLGVPRTRLEAKWMNALQNELISMPQQVGIALSEADDKQLLQSVALHVGTLTALSALPVPAVPAGRTVLVYVERSGAPINDVGGFFRWQAESSAADDQDSVIQPDSDPATGRWIRVQTTGSFRVTQPEVDAGAPIVDRRYCVGHIHRYGAVPGNAVANRVAINASLAVCVAGGGGKVIFGNALDYTVGDSNSAENIFSVIYAKNIIFEGHNSRILMNTTGGNFQPVLFNLFNPENVTFNDLRFRDDGANLAVDWKGAWAVYLQASLVPGIYGHVVLNNCHGESLVRFVTAGPAATGIRIKGIQFNNCSTKNVYYPLPFENNGDDVTAVNFRAWNPRRAYFAYGVQNHDIDLKVFIDGDAVPAESMHLIKSYASGYPTRNIKLRTKVYGDLTAYTSFYGITLEHQPATGDVTHIENVDAEISLAGVTAGYVRPFHLSSVNNDTGLEETTTTNNVWRHLRFGGDISKYQGHVVGSPANWAPIDTRVSPITECDIELAPSLVASWPFNAFKNNFVLKLTADRDARFRVGDLTAQTVTIPLAGFDQTSFTLKVRIWMHDDYEAVSTQNTTYMERLIVAYNAGAGVVAIQSNETLLRHVVGDVGGVSFTASGENIDVTFSGAAYSGPRARVRVDTEFVSLMRAR